MFDIDLVGVVCFLFVCACFVVVFSFICFLVVCLFVLFCSGFGLFGLRLWLLLFLGGVLYLIIFYCFFMLVLVVVVLVLFFWGFHAGLFCVTPLISTTTHPA